MSHKIRSEGVETAVARSENGRDRGRPETYWQYVEDRPREQRPKSQEDRRPKQNRGEICGLGAMPLT